MFRASLNRIGRNAMAQPPARHGALRLEDLGKCGFQSETFLDETRSQQGALVPEQKIAATSDCHCLCGLKDVLFLRCLFGGFCPICFCLVDWIEHHQAD